MDCDNYPHPWEQDQALTERLLKLVDDEDWNLFGIADVGPLNEKARPGRRPKDLWPTAKAVLMFAVGLADPFTRGWVQNGKSGKFYSYALLELDRRVWTVKRFLRQEGYLYFGGESYGGAILGDYYFHQRQCEAIINVKPNMDYYSDFVKQDCDRCLRVCPQGKVKWKNGKEVRP